MKILRISLLTLWVYGLAGWIYIAGNAIVHPVTLAWPLTHFAPYPHEDTFGAICFAVSLVCFFGWNVLREQGK